MAAKSVLVHFGSRTKIVKFDSDEALNGEVKKSFNLDSDIHLIVQVS